MHAPFPQSIIIVLPTLGGMSSGRVALVLPDEERGELQFDRTCRVGRGGFTRMSHSHATGSKQHTSPIHPFLPSLPQAASAGSTSSTASALRSCWRWGFTVRPPLRPTSTRTTRTVGARGWWRATRRGASWCGACTTAAPARSFHYMVRGRPAWVFSPSSFGLALSPTTTTS